MDQKEYRTRPSRKLGLGGILLRLALVLLCLVLLSVYLMDGLYARYKSEGSGEDSARVAKFHVVTEGVGAKDITVAVTNANSDSGSVQFVVTNNSEVAVEYYVVLTLDQLHAGVTATIDGDSGSAAGNQITFLDLGALPVGPATGENHVLNFAVDWDAFTEHAGGPDHSVTLNYSVTIYVVQID